MKHYLDLIHVSARVHRRQSRMTRLCIVFAVFLVTVIFSMADMELRTQKIQEIRANGTWHAGFKQISPEQAALIGARPEVTCTSWYGALNYGLDSGYQIQGVETVVCGFEQTFLELMPAQKIAEGVFPQDDESIICTQSMKERLGAELGDTVLLETPAGPREYRIAGFTGNTSMLTRNDAFGIFLNIEGFRELVGPDSEWEKDFIFYVQFTQRCMIQKTIEDIQNRLGLSEEQVSQNTKLLALMFQSSDSYMVKLYMTAAVLALLVTAAGIFMISASLNSNVVQRTEFFGMMRCLGATRKQVARFVHREALSWCRTAIPAGIVAAVAVVWGLCAMLRFLSPGIFQEMPQFVISLPGAAAGVVVGLLTVLLASRAPAKKASKVSPLTAASGNAGTIHAAKKAANTRLFPVDIALGVHHATGSKKNFSLMMGSFAFSIILFLAFSTAIDFMHHAINPLQPYAPDVTISTQELTCSLPVDISREIEELPAVKKAFGRQYVPELKAAADGKETSVLLLSYEKNQFEWAEDMLLSGSLEEVENGTAVLAVYGEGASVITGSCITVETQSGSRTVPVAGILSNCPYTVGTEKLPLICSERLFQEITGETGYVLIDIQMTSDASDQDVEMIRDIAGGEVNVSDRRESNAEARGAYYSFALFLYGFLVIIGMITIFNIVNSVAMSVSARMKEYGVMRAVGMSEGQLVRMVAGEAAAYAGFGILFGCLLGLPVNCVLFRFLVTARWGDAWQLPVRELLVILAVMAFSLCLAIWGPSKRIRKMSVVDTIAAQN
ncbi:MAG: FtsX-like permease family protein [Lachnospiraceae bacterium]|nr:FtsX-like permease family protein [Lachnospiraceae bacterium]